MTKDIDTAGLTSPQIAGLKLLQLGEDIITKRQKWYQDQLQKLTPELVEATKQRITEELEQLGSKSLEDYRKRTAEIIKKWAIEQSIARQHRPIRNARITSAVFCCLGGACAALNVPELAAFFAIAGATSGSLFCKNNKIYDKTLKTAIANQPNAAEMLRAYDSKDNTKDE